MFFKIKEDVTGDANIVEKEFLEEVFYFTELIK